MSSRSGIWTVAPGADIVPTSRTGIIIALVVVVGSGRMGRRRKEMLDPGRPERRGDGQFGIVVGEEVVHGRAEELPRDVVVEKRHDRFERRWW